MKPNRRNLREIILVLLTGIGKLIFVDFLDAKFWFVLFAGLGWVIYLVWNIIYNPQQVKNWGFKSEGFRSSFRVLLLPSLGVLILSISYGFYERILILNWNIIAVLVLYPVWGTIQQWLVICLFGNNLIERESFSVKMTYCITAILFGIIHYPSTLLMAGTLFLSIVYLYVFSRHKNILALGLFHGWLGAIFYYFVLGRDAWLEFIKVL